MVAKGFNLSNLADILHIPANFWLQMASFIRKWMLADSHAGFMQGEKQDHYRSREYMERKKNYFKKKDGNNRLQLKGRSVVSNHTSSVNMLLTGELIEGLHFERMIGNTGAVYAFDDKDKNKILGNKYPYGRIMNTLNEANAKKFISHIENVLEENILKIVKDKLVININM